MVAARGFSVGSSVRGDVSRGSLQALTMYRRRRYFKGILFGRLVLFGRIVA